MLGLWVHVWIPVGALVELAKDICKHKLCEMSALLHVRQREVLQEVV